jgi:homoserine dehydrogenase
VAYKIGILGLGTVGTGTVDILCDPVDRHPSIGTIEIARVGVKSLDKPRTSKLPQNLLTTDLESIVSDPEIAIIVELLGGLEPARSLILTAIKSGKHIITANKAVIARYGEEIFTAANEAGVYVLIEAAVGGGIPIIKPLKQSLGVNRINRVTGIINGTTNYILTQMSEKGADFGEILVKAQELGYAEADPTADVDGWDAADKIAILASLAFGGRVKREDVYAEGIRSVSAADISYADRLGFRIKLLAVAQVADVNTRDQLQLRVHPTLVPKSHPLASVNNVYNAILVEGDPIGQVMFFGRGAGAGPTASAVVSDLLNVIALLEVKGNSLDPLLSCSHRGYCSVSPIEDVITRFYVRFLCADLPGVIGHLGTCFGNNKVSLESIVQIDSQNEVAEIVVVTHDVREGNFRQALTNIQSSPAIQSIPSILRVL